MHRFDRLEAPEAIVLYEATISYIEELENSLDAFGADQEDEITKTEQEKLDQAIVLNRELGLVLEAWNLLGS